MDLLIDNSECLSYNVAGNMACRPVLTHTILMLIIFEHYKHLTKLVSDKTMQL